MPDERPTTQEGRDLLNAIVHRYECSAGFVMATEWRPLRALAEEGLESREVLQALGCEMAGPKYALQIIKAKNERIADLERQKS